MEKVSLMTLKRLPRYLRILKELDSQNEINVSSTKIANELGLNSIQVRKDLALVSHQDGKPKVGFVVKELITDIETFLNLNSSKNVVIIGAGRLGQALMNYSGFENDINIVMAFDNNELKCDNKTVFNFKDFGKIIKDIDVEIAIITVPKDYAQEVCDKVIENGIKIIWNFAPVDLKIPEFVKIKNEDLSASLAILLHEARRK